MKLLLLFLAACLLALAAVFLLVTPKLTTAPTSQLVPPPVQATIPAPDKRVAALDDFFRRYNCPALNYSLVNNYLNAADKYGVDWRLLPAISIKESSCGKHYPVDTNNPYGFGSARIKFADLSTAIDYIIQRLATAYPYAGKTNLEKLEAYGPHDNLNYAPEVYKLMQQIDENN